VLVDLGSCWAVQGRPADGRAQIRAGIAEGTGVTGDDAVLLCASLVVAAGAIARAGDGAVLGQRRAPAARRGQTDRGPHLGPRRRADLGRGGAAGQRVRSGGVRRRARPGEHVAALRVFGAVEAQHRGAGVPWRWDKSVATLLTAMTTRLGPAAAERAREEGARATLAELADA
jgi:hypothetical protein